MTTSEDDIQDFFAELKAQDEQVAPPPFPGLPARKRQSRLRYLLPLTAAASVLLLLSFWRSHAESSPATTAEGVLVIFLETPPETPTETLLVEPESVYAWESPSNALIDDF